MKPQDLLVVLKLATIADPQKGWTYAWLSDELGLSTSETHAAVKRALKSGLLRQGLYGIGPNPRELMDFLIHGVRFVFPGERTPMTRGIRTSTSAPPLAARFASGDEPPLVWPDPMGDTRGIGLLPLYRSVPDAARKDACLYELLVLVDALRDGRQREKSVARRHIEAVLQKLIRDFQYGVHHPLEQQVEPDA